MSKRKKAAKKSPLRIPVQHGSITRVVTFKGKTKRDYAHEWLDKKEAKIRERLVNWEPSEITALVFFGGPSEAEGGLKQRKADIDAALYILQMAHYCVDIGDMNGAMEHAFQAGSLSMRGFREFESVELKSAGGEEGGKISGETRTERASLFDSVVEDLLTTSQIEGQQSPNELASKVRPKIVKYVGLWNRRDEDEAARNAFHDDAPDSLRSWLAAWIHGPAKVPAESTIAASIRTIRKKIP